MIGVLLLLAPCLQGSTPEASAWVQPDRVAIGEPFTLSLDILTGPEQRVLLDDPEGESDDFGLGFAVVEPRRLVRLPAGDAEGRVLTQARWRLVALEPGVLELTAPGADVFLDGTALRLEPSTTTIEVRPELAEGEDSPRPLAGFREPPADVPRRWRGVLLLLVALGGVLVLGLGLGAVAAATGRRRAAVAGRPPTPLERLAALDPADEAACSELHHELARCVREALDQAAGVSLAGLTDEEWLARHEGLLRIEPSRLERAGRLLEACASVKYAGAGATRFATEERLAEARSLCDVPAALVEVRS